MVSLNYVKLRTLNRFNDFNSFKGIMMHGVPKGSIFHTEPKTYFLFYLMLPSQMFHFKGLCMPSSLGFLVKLENIETK